MSNRVAGGRSREVASLVGGKLGSRFGAAALVLLFWAASLYGLDVTPPLHQDEPWQASVGWKLATEGVFGSDMFAGHYGMDQRYYGFMPLHSLMLAGLFRVAGLGLFQARLETVALGLLALCLTYALGKRLFDATTGLLAATLLVCLPLLQAGGFQPTGVPLLDFARIARYDMAAAAFGLAALHAFVTAMRRRQLRWVGLSGLLAGLASLSHLYGVFWLAALALLVVWNRRELDQPAGGWRALGALAAGFLLPWLPYGVYVLGDLAAWRGQTREYAPRFDLLNPAWYLDNLRREPLRYRLGLADGWLRPGLLAAALLLPIAWIGLARRALSGRDANARAVLTPALLIPLLFALLIALKLPNYLATFWPLWALCMAWALVALWRRASSARWGALLRAAAAVLVVAVALEGSLRLAAGARQVQTQTPYAVLAAQLRDQIPAGSTVLGLHRFWFGLHDRDYRSWFVPIVQSDSRYHDPPLTPEQALDALAPDVILVDPEMRAYLAGARYGETAANPQEFADWLASRGFRVTAAVDDPTYGLIEVYSAPARRPGSSF